MTVKWRLVFTIAFVVLGLSLRAAAHHGQAGLFDTTRTIDLRGTVKKWSFVNPHPILQLEVTDKDGTADWDVYFGPSAAAPLRRQGFTAEIFRAGETILVTGHPATAAGARGIDVFGKGTSVRRADGKAIP